MGGGKTGIVTENVFVKKNPFKGLDHELNQVKSPVLGMRCNKTVKHVNCKLY